MELFLGEKRLTTTHRAFIMGILNATPDSFYETSRVSTENAVSRAKKLVNDGADILDIGAVSTRPGSKEISTKEELSRLIPVVKSVRAAFPNIAISIDTTNPIVAQECYKVGALDLLNDIDALEESDMARFALSSGVSVVLMHRLSHDIKPLSAPCFNIVDEYLRRRVEYARALGIAREKIIVDVGIGFGKDKSANEELLDRCGDICDGEYSVLIALSHKRGYKTADETLNANRRAIDGGATIIRVHEVALSGV